jgi:hypothetical protein
MVAILNVVVDKSKGMHELDSDSKGQGGRGIANEGFRCQQAQEGSHALARRGATEAGTEGHSLV